MSVQIKVLSNVGPSLDQTNSVAGAEDLYNVIGPQAGIVYDLYTAPNTSPNFKAAIVKTIRLVNTHTASVKVNLYHMKLGMAAPNGMVTNGPTKQRRRHISPVDFSIPPGGMYIDDSEVTLEQGDRIQGKADTANVIEYVIS